MADSALALRLLGLAAWRCGDEAWQVLSRKDALLLALLCLEGAQSRQRAAQLLWPQVPAARSQANLRQRLFRLRRQGAALIHEDEQRLSLAADLSCDLNRHVCAEVADLGATLLAGLEEVDDAAQAWLSETRAAWALRRLDELGAAAARHEARGEIALALAHTEQLLASDALREQAWRRLMRLHARRGDRAAAVAAFERCERHLRDELGLKPSAETLALLHEVEQGQPQGAGSEALAALPMALLHPPRLVGRQAQRQAAQGAWQSGQVFVLVGEAGLGKSRLMAELAVAGPARVLQAARPGDDAVAYATLARLLRAMARAAPRPEALWPLGRSRQELARLLPELGAAPAAPGLEALLLAALEEVFARAPAAGLQALLLDDVQHADAASLGVLRRVAPRAGIAWALASRPAPPGPLQDWLAASSEIHLCLLPALEVQSLTELLVSLKLPGLDAQSMAPALLRHCGGNPLFVLETLKHLVLQGQSLPAALDAPPLPLPASVEALLGQRLARLSSAAQDLARVAAVAGSDFQAEVAADVLGQGLLALADPWAELQAAQVLHEDRFSHEALHDAVLRALPQALRAPLHARVAHSLQRHGAPVQRVARHFAWAGQPAQAAGLALQAASQALRLGRSAERLGHLRDALQWFRACDRFAEAFDAALEEVQASLAHEGLGQAQALAQALLPLATTPEQTLQAHLSQAGVALAGYDVALILSASAAVLALAGAQSPPYWQALALQAAGQAMQGRPLTALAAVAQLLPHLNQMTDELSDALQAAQLWSHCAVVFNSAGQASDCVAALQQQRRLAQAAGHAELEASALASLSGQSCSLGEGQVAVEQGRAAAALHRRMGAEDGAVRSDINLAIALIGQGQWREAQAVVNTAQAHVARTAADTDLSRVVADLQAAICLRTGAAEAALAYLHDRPDERLNQPGRLNRHMLRAQAAWIQGGAPQAAAHWQALRALLSAEPGTGLRLVARALTSHLLPWPAARAELDALLRQAQDTGFPAGQAISLMQRTNLAVLHGDGAQAQADAQALLALGPRALHLFVDQGELRACVQRSLRAAGRTALADAQREDAAAWLAQQVWPNLPEYPPNPTHEVRALWLAHPGRRGLLG